MHYQFEKRRHFLKIIASAGLGILAEVMQQKAAFAAANPTPLVDARFPVEIADGVWIIPDHRIPLIPNIGIVLGRRIALVIDTGLGMQSGRNTLDAVRLLAGHRDIVLTTTHGHPEHTSGAASFPFNVEYIANAQQVQYLARSGKALIELFRSVLGGEVKQLLSDVRLRLPQSVYDKETFDLDLGDRLVRFKTWGTAHSPGDQVIFVPDAKVLFAGDLVEERMFPIVPFYPPQIGANDIDVGQWVRVLGAFHGINPSIIVPGHGDVGGLEISNALADYLVQDQAEVRRLYKNGRRGDELLEQVRSNLINRYPTWEQPDRIDIATCYFAQQS